ncbi:MAG TPA: flagellar protein FlgN [Gaiellaceae bacterium]|nr:flagellar protein FlgN [Gaiellaceae bacterium]
MNRLLDHMRKQLESSRRLLEVVLQQNGAIRRQDVETVLASLADVQAEMAYRARLEVEREQILASAAALHGIAPESVDLETFLVGAPPAEADEARRMSAELMGLLLEIGRVHDQNRILIRQELTFLDHLMRVLSNTPQAGYSPTGWASVPQAHNVVNARV